MGAGGTESVDKVLKPLWWSVAWCHLCMLVWICMRQGGGPSVTVVSSMARRGESKGGNWMMAPMVGRGCFQMRKLCAWWKYRLWYCELTKRGEGALARTNCSFRAAYYGLFSQPRLTQFGERELHETGLLCSCETLKYHTLEKNELSCSHTMIVVWRKSLIKADLRSKKSRKD